jgi:quercetin dioxygenase-like cupin family protein
MKKFRTMTGAAAAALLASVCLIAPSFATSGSGFTPSGIVVGHYGTLNVNTASDKTEKWGMILKTLDATDVGADKLTVAAGGYSGWHSHPSAVFVTVTQGSITWYDGSNPLCTPHTYTAGQSFIEPAYHIHDVRSAGGAEFIAIHINPTGTSGPAFRIDEAQPNNCSF